MKELRAEPPIRILFAFDPRRTAILLIGGDKSLADDPTSPTRKQWYDHYIPLADDLYDTPLQELRQEGRI
jgi:hypothetical protein